MRGADAVTAPIRLLNKFIDSFVSRNGFHLNGDFQDHGDSSFKYRPFTLEGNFVAMQAIHEMLLHAEAGVIRLVSRIAGGMAESFI